MARPDLRSSDLRVAQAVEEAAGLYRQGRRDDAEKICTRVIKARPDWFDALHLLGVIRLDGGKAGAGFALIESALKLNPQSPQALCNLGRALAMLNRDEEALAAIDRALALAPDDFEALNGRGIVLLKLGRTADALAAFERAAALEPRFLGARLNRGTALAQLGRAEEAVAEFDAVLALTPGHAETIYNRGVALGSLGRHAEAIASYDRALAIRPDYLKALVSRGMSGQALNRHEEALADCARALALDRNNADAHHNEALARLTLGDYRRGFEKYEWRWQRTGMPARRRSFGKPLWLGEYPLARKTILLHAEQGLGDTIQFARYAPLIARTGAKVVLEVQPELKELLERVEGVTGVVARGEELPAFDVHCPVGSLPRALRTEPATIPAESPYLKASEERLARWRARIERLPSPRIAIAWAGGAGHVNDRNRSIALAMLAPLLALDRIGFVSIQRELRSGDAEALARFPQLLHVGAELADFDDTGAVVSLVDVVISVDTSVVHLAGALGRPTWILVPFSPDWRWMLAREDSPWYPTARLFRQPAPGDWDSVIAKVSEELARL
jgi:tetratricopeptide (TPR) repeat protein